MIIFLFGLPGVGKTYLGELIQKKAGACFWDGDHALTEEMKEAVDRERPFSPQMTADLSATIINKIKELQTRHPFIVVSQAMLREADRQTFQQHFPTIRFIYISCAFDVASQRIADRANFVSVSYFTKLTEAFEPHRLAAETYPTISNYGKTDEQLIEEFQAIIDKKPKLNLDPAFFNSNETPIISTPPSLLPGIIPAS